MHIKRTGIVKNTAMRRECNAAANANLDKQPSTKQILNGSAFLLAIFTNEALIGHVFAWFLKICIAQTGPSFREWQEEGGAEQLPAPLWSNIRDLSLDSSDRYENKNDDCPSGSAHHKALG